MLAAGSSGNTNRPGRHSVLPAHRPTPAEPEEARRWCSDRRAAQVPRASDRRTESRSERHRSCSRRQASTPTMLWTIERNGQPLTKTRALAYPRTPRTHTDREPELSARTVNKLLTVFRRERKRSNRL